MANFIKLSGVTIKLITSAGALALMTGASLVTTSSAFAAECENSAGGTQTTEPDDTGDGNALACGNSAIGSGDDAVALGAFTTATGIEAIAIGFNADGAAEDAIAIGADSLASGNESIAIGADSDATGTNSTALGTAASAAASATALGHGSSAADQATALGRGADAAQSGVAVGWFSEATPGSVSIGLSAEALAISSIAIGSDATAEGTESIAVGPSASAKGPFSIGLGYSTNRNVIAGNLSIALGAFASARGVNSVAIGSDTIDVDFFGADAQGAESIVIGPDASDAGFDRAIVMGANALATEADQVILKDADTFTILGNGDTGLGTAMPSGTLDVHAGTDNSTLVLSQSGTTPVQWEIKNNQVTGRMTFGPLGGNVPLKFGSTAVNNLLRIGTVKNNRVDIGGDMVVAGTVTTSGPTCGGGCDAVFDADYDLPSIEEHAAEMFANKHLPAVGPTNPFEPINLSERYGNLLNELEKAHIYIAQQEERITKQDRELAEIRLQIALLMNQ